MSTAGAWLPTLKKFWMQEKRGLPGASSEPYQGLNPQIWKEHQWCASTCWSFLTHSFLTCHHHREYEDLQGREVKAQKWQSTAWLTGNRILKNKTNVRQLFCLFPQAPSACTVQTPAPVWHWQPQKRKLQQTGCTHRLQRSQNYSCRSNGCHIFRWLSAVTGSPAAPWQSPDILQLTLPLLLWLWIKATEGPGDTTGSSSNRRGQWLLVNPTACCLSREHGHRPVQSEQGRVGWRERWPEITLPAVPLLELGRQIKQTEGRGLVWSDF